MTTWKEGVPYVIGQTVIDEQGKPVLITGVYKSVMSDKHSCIGCLGGEGMTEQDTIELWGKRYELDKGSRQYATMRSSTRTYYQDPQYGLVWVNN